MANAKTANACQIWYGKWEPSAYPGYMQLADTRIGGGEMMSSIPEKPALYRANLVDSRDHEIITVGPFVANSDAQARLMAWAKAAEDDKGLNSGVVEYYDIVLEFLGMVRPRRDEE